MNLFSKIKKIYWQKKVLRKCKVHGVSINVNHKSKVTKNTILGSNIHFNGLTIKGGGKVSIGDNFHSGRDCLIITHIHNYDNGNRIPYDDTLILKNVTIAENVWIGDRVIILGGVMIGEGAIIQAGSVVVSDIPEFAIAGGHPAIVFKKRDVDHYMRLKNKNLYY